MRTASCWLEEGQVEVEVTEAGVVASFQLEAPVRQTARRLVTIDNPLPADAPVTFAEGDGWWACDDRCLDCSVVAANID